MDEIGNFNLDRFISGATQEEFQRQAEQARTLTHGINDGKPIPSTSAKDIQQIWHASRQMNIDMPPRPNVATGLAAYASYGVEAACEPARFMPVQFRYWLLSSLFERGVLNQYVHGDELDEKVFVAAATMPYTKDDLGEVMLPKVLTEAPEEIAVKAQKDMRARGYDPTSPNIDGKFLRWLRENC